jgi:hypothetical protein
MWRQYKTLEFHIHRTCTWLIRLSQKCDDNDQDDDYDDGDGGGVIDLL